MSLEVIGAGLGRTGTASLKVALEKLGYRNCYHFGEMMSNVSHIEHWVQAVEGNPDWPHLFKDYDAAVDCPACNFWDELMEVYPDAKIILTIRDANKWFDSVHTTIHSPRLLEHHRRTPLKDLVEKVILRNYGDRVDDRSFMVSYFEQRNELIIKAIPAERLLVYHVKEGWEPLCNFLKKPVPEEPFPRVNSREDTKRLMEMVLARGLVEEFDEDDEREISKLLFA